MSIQIQFHAWFYEYNKKKRLQKEMNKMSVCMANRRMGDSLIKNFK